MEVTIGEINRLSRMANQSPYLWDRLDAGPCGSLEEPLAPGLRLKAVGILEGGKADAGSAGRPSRRRVTNEGDDDGRESEGLVSPVRTGDGLPGRSEAWFRGPVTAGGNGGRLTLRNPFRPAPS